MIIVIVISITELIGIELVQYSSTFVSTRWNTWCSPWWWWWWCPWWLHRWCPGAPQLEVWETIAHTVPVLWVRISIEMIFSKTLIYLDFEACFAMCQCYDANDNPTHTHQAICVLDECFCVFDSCPYGRWETRWFYTLNVVMIKICRLSSSPICCTKGEIGINCDNYCDDYYDIACWWTFINRYELN